MTALKRNELLAHVTTGVYLEDMILSEMINHKRTNTLCIHLCAVLKAVKLTEIKSRMVVVGGSRGNCSAGTEVLFGVM